MQGLYVDRLLSRSSLRFTEDARRALQKMALPLRDLIGVNVRLLR